MKHLGLVAVVVAGVACRSKAPERRAYAVGSEIGGGSVFGPGPKCTYEVTPQSSGDLYESKEGGKLIGPGTMRMKCESGYEEEFDIVPADKLAIGGDDKLEVGKAGALRVTMFGGGRELKTDGHWVPDWKVPADCDRVMKTDVDSFVGADSLHGSYRLEMTAVAKGSCTVTASVLGQTSTRTVTIN
jgi:hypothetical protein